MNALKFITEANKQHIRRLLGWSELEYANFVAKKGIEYMKEVLFADEWAIAQLTKGGHYWSWWKNHWNKRDEEFIMNVAFYHDHLLFSEYNRLHTITGGIYPHSHILEQGFALLMDRINQDAIMTETGAILMEFEINGGHETE